MRRASRIMITAVPVGPFLMREIGSTQPRRATVAWPRRAVVGLWLLFFLVGGGALAARWDVLMARLARPPVGNVAAGGALP
jgi:hypothetical protein